MIFWIIAGGLATIAVGLLLLPLLRRPPHNAPRATYDLSVYRDQLAEIARETERGEIDAEAAQAARGEVERRLLTAADAASANHRADKRGPARGGVWGFGIGLAVVLPLAAVVLYLVLGNPGVPSLPFAERPAPPSQEQAARARPMRHSLRSKANGRSPFPHRTEKLSSLSEMKSSHAFFTPGRPSQARGFHSRSQ